MKTYYEYFHYELAQAISKQLNKLNKLVPAEALAQLIGSIYTRYYQDPQLVEITSVDVIEAVKKYPQEFKLYGNLIGLLQKERELWLNHAYSILEKEGKELTIARIVEKAYEQSIDLIYNSKNFDSERIVEEIAKTFSNIFYLKKDIQGRNSWRESEVIYLGLNLWKSKSVELNSEIDEILRNSKISLPISMLCYKINKRANYHKKDFNELRVEELKEELKKMTNIKINEDDTVEILS